MKKSVFFVTSLNSGGIENYLLRFLTYFEGDLKPIIICKGNEYGELETKYKRIENIQLLKKNLGFVNLQAYYSLYVFFKKNNIESVCDFTGNFSGLILFTAKLARVNTRLAFYRGSTNRFSETKIRLLYNKMVKYLVKRSATKILSNSVSALDFFFYNRNRMDAKYKVIYNGIDAEKFILNSNKVSKENFKLPTNSFIIGHTGRYDVSKNHETILRVAKVICAKYDSIYFLLCGKDTDKYLEKIISNDPILKNKVKLLGYRNDVHNILHILDLYFFPSITEGQPNSLIEAMIVGLPVIASNISPIKETTPSILHKELKDPLDVLGFSNKIEEYYLDEQKRKINNYSDWAKKQFNPKQKFSQFYKEL